ncbi:unnamed protein product [Ceratitis capitata]|uniref:(Mediterranean fruit fly) hypothetical protein n=1 Tax=Ceratitis capitata TaxID=7213 RepID=A0A811UYB7_CERCA|nr:unnamed protein product [Ceratitis capitata]
MLNTDDPIELSDDSVDCSSTTVLDMLPSNNRKELNLLFPQREDYMSISNDPTSSRDQQKSKKANKFIKNSKKKFSIPTDNLPQLDLLSTEKGGVGKLAGGSDLIPLISTGSAYSSKTIPSTSLTATVASSFSLSKTDTYPSNAFENSLSSTNIEDLLSTEKGGVGKLAGGSDLIPLISTGSAYSSKTIPSTSLTATVASSFSLSKTDIYPSNAFENSLSSTNIEVNELSVMSEDKAEKAASTKMNGYLQKQSTDLPSNQTDTLLIVKIQTLDRTWESLLKAYEAIFMADAYPEVSESVEQKYANCSESFQNYKSQMLEA